jgi:hypothetical protein
MKIADNIVTKGYIKRTTLVHEAPATAGSGEGQMYTALPPRAERPFPHLKLETSR